MVVFVISPSGKVWAFHDLHVSSNNDYLTGWYPRADGRRTVVTNAIVNGAGGHGRVREYDPEFNLLWQATLQLPAVGYLYGGQRTADGGLVQLAKSGAGVGLLRVNPWSHDSCVAAGKCAEPEPAGCADGNPCTFDNCLPVSGCTPVLHKLACNDGDFCTAGEQCVSGSCVGQPTVCDDNLGCTADACEAGKGCTFVPLPDGIVCATGKVCVAGACQ